MRERRSNRQTIASRSARSHYVLLGDCAGSDVSRLEFGRIMQGGDDWGADWGANWYAAVNDPFQIVPSSDATFSGVSRMVKAASARLLALSLF